MFRVLIAHADAEVSAVLKSGLEREPGIAVVESATDGLTALSALRELAPNIIVVGTLHGPVDESAFLRAVHARRPPVLVVGLDLCGIDPAPPRWEDS